MTWPTPQDYNEAVQNPKVCFGDAELRDGTPELTPLGLPKPISGAFASVYQMNCGPRRWAVRCFLREVSDHQARYQAISAHLQAANLPSTVGFEFLSRGIRIRGEWYPILKMEWIDGEPLNAYIERHLNNPAAIQSLARRWIETLAALRRAWNRARRPAARQCAREPGADQADRLRRHVRPGARRLCQPRGRAPQLPASRAEQQRIRPRPRRLFGMGRAALDGGPDGRPAALAAAQWRRRMSPLKKRRFRQARAVAGLSGDSRRPHARTAGDRPAGAVVSPVAAVTGAGRR